MNAHGKTFTALFSAALAASALCEDRPATWIDELEESSDYIEPDCIDDDDEFAPPFPKDVEEKYNLTKDEVLVGLKTIATKYDAGETDKKRIKARSLAIGAIGTYGTTNDLAFLSTILNNPNDHAQQAAIGATLCLLTGTDGLIPFVHSVATNHVAFSSLLRIWTECNLMSMCDNNDAQCYIDDPVLHAKIAAYFIERASEEVELSLGIDADACKLNPWYRHSQLRRDNLARARSREKELSETAAAAYDARQRDAAAEGD